MLQYVYGSQVAKFAPSIKPIALSEPHVAAGRAFVKYLSTPLRTMSRRSPRMR